MTPSQVRVGANRESGHCRPRRIHALGMPSALAPPTSTSGLSPISHAPERRWPTRSAAIAKMRVFRYSDFLGAALMLGVLATLLRFVSRLT